MRVVSCSFSAFGCALGALAGAGCEMAVEQACEDLAAAECGHLAACSRAMLAARYRDVAACERAVAERCVELPALPAAELGPGEIEACAAAYGHHPCESLALGATPEACRFAGKGTNGSKCASGAQCRSSFCEPDPGGAEGRCAAVRKLGDLCSLGGSPCDAGLHCGDGGRCVPYGSVGDPCSPAAPCNPLYWCEYELCASPAAAGEPCAPCSGGATCDMLEGLVCEGGKCQTAGISILSAPAAPACE